MTGGRSRLVRAAVTILLCAASPPSGGAIVLQPISRAGWRAAGVGGTGCWWRAAGDGRWRYAMSGRAAYARIAGRALAMSPGRRAHALFPFTFDRWRAGAWTVEVAMGGPASRRNDEILEVPVRLRVARPGFAVDYAGTLSCGS